MVTIFTPKGKEQSLDERLGEQGRITYAAFAPRDVIMPLSTGNPLALKIEIHYGASGVYCQIAYGHETINDIFSEFAHRRKRTFSMEPKQLEKQSVTVHFREKGTPTREGADAYGFSFR